MVLAFEQLSPIERGQETYYSTPRLTFYPVTRVHPVQRKHIICAATMT